MRHTLLFEEHGNSIIASSLAKIEAEKEGFETQSERKVGGESFEKTHAPRGDSLGGGTWRVAPATGAATTEVEKPLPNGDLYTGSLVGSVPYGLGKYLCSDGRMYEGEWKRGKASGDGRFSWPSGATYEGEFEAGRIEGSGHFIGAGGETYSGSWSADRKHGQGQEMYANGDSYDGCWRRNLQDGQGRYVWTNGSSYTGQWKNGVISGRGVLIWPDGNRVEGQWDHGIPKANDVSGRPDESWFGSWNQSMDNQQHHGRGTLYPRLVEEVQNGALASGGIFPLARKRSSVESERSSRKICIWDSDDEDGDITCDIVDDAEASILYRGVPGLDCDGFRQLWRRPCHLKSDEVKRPGETISKGHKNYDLMLSLQVGIRYSVGKHASILGDLKPSDFDPREKFATRFPPEGSKVTPPHQSADFRWKDYCPLVFRHLRELFHVDPADYMLAICGDDALRELCSPGKSGSFFYLTQDDRFMIKTVRKSEVKVLLRMLSSYCKHVRGYENSLVTRFYGVHSVKPVGGQKTRFIVMGNLFRSEYPIHKRFDLKGSSHGRATDKPEEEIDETTTLKDLDLNYVFHLQGKLFEELIRQINIDCEFLEAERIMDYSLLVGLHFREGDAFHNEKFMRGCGFLEAELQDMVQILPRRKSSMRLGANMPAMAERVGRKSDYDQCVPGCGETYEVVLYCGIIDILQDYDISKRLEHAYKSLHANPASISAVGPKLYSKRFREFIRRVFVEDER